MLNQEGQNVDLTWASLKPIIKQRRKDRPRYCTGNWNPKRQQKGVFRIRLRLDHWVRVTHMHLSWNKKWAQGNCYYDKLTHMGFKPWLHFQLSFRAKYIEWNLIISSQGLLEKSDLQGKQAPAPQGPTWILSFEWWMGSSYKALKVNHLFDRHELQLKIK